MTLPVAALVRWQPAERARGDRALEAIETLNRVGAWELDLATGALWWSDGVYRLFGVTGTLPGSRARARAPSQALTPLAPGSRSAASSVRRDPAALPTPRLPWSLLRHGEQGP